MIFHAIAKLKDAGIVDILIVTGKEHMGDVVNLCGSGRELGISLTYKVQDEAGGIAQALGMAENFVNGDQMVVILGDNVFSDRISSYVEKFIGQVNGAKILIQEVHDPERYGVPELAENRILSIEEKPQLPRSTYAVTGIYMYDSRVFDIIRTLKPSGRGELEITDVNNAYIAANALTYDILQGWWTDAGTHESYIRANELAKNIVYDEAFGKLR